MLVNVLLTSCELFKTYAYRVVVGDESGVVRVLMIEWKSKIGVLSGVINATESESEESERFRFIAIPSLTIRWKPACRSRKQKRKDNPITMLVSTLCDWLSCSVSTCDRKKLDRKRDRSRCRNQKAVFTISVVTLSAADYELRLRLRLRREWNNLKIYWSTENYFSQQEEKIPTEKRWCISTEQDLDRRVYFSVLYIS